MKGLILKDFYTMARYGKTMLALIGFYMVLAFLGQPASFVSAMMSFLCAMLVLSSFSYDEYGKWNKYCLSLPVSRRQIVGGKYLFALIMLVIGLALGILGGYFLSLTQDISFAEEVLPSCLGGAVAALFMLAVLLPLMYRFGVEKGRILMLAVCLLPVILMLGAVKFMEAQGIPMPDEATVLVWLKILPCLVLAGFIGSYLVSVAVFMKKEL
ncbi:MAG: ABC-2 transporter permease [Peptococcaceae bacterium]|nr:ABC-2 transporter permease [Peptococcaceae bacterium]